MNKYTRLYHKIKRRLNSIKISKNALPLALIPLIAFSLYLVLHTLSASPRAPKLKAGTGDVLYSVSNEIYSSSIGTKDGIPRIGFSVGSSQAGFVLAGSAKVKPVRDGSNNSVLFPGVQPGVDLRYTPTVNGLKEEIVLGSAPASTSSSVFLFDLLLSNVVPKKLANNYIDPTFKDDKGVYQFHFEKPYAVDAKGNRTNNVLLQIGEDKQIPGKYYMKLIVDQVWLKDKTRAYPVTIDPTVVHNSTSQFALGYFDRVKDTGSGSTPTLEDYYQPLPVDAYTVALWHMDETSDNTCTGGVNDICDKSGFVNDGAATGTTINTTTQKLGAAARTFNGTTDFISAGTGTSLAFAYTDKFTVEAWIKTTTGGYITDKMRNTGTGVMGYETLVSGGKYVFNIDSSSVGSNTLTSNGTVNDGLWHHVAAVYDTTHLIVYIDGKFDNAMVRTLTPTIKANDNFSIGVRRYDGANQGGFFGGSIDEIRISNTARSAEEIKADASRRPSAVYTSPALDLGGASSWVTTWNPLQWTELGVTTGDGETLKDSTSLAAQWNFNNTSNTTTLTNDAGSCSTTCNGTLTNFGTGSSAQEALAGSGWTATNRRWGAGALMFDGSNDYVALTDVAAYKPTTAMAIEAWVRPTSYPVTAAMIMDHQSATPYYGYTFYMMPSGILNFQTYMGAGPYTALTSNTPLTLGQWHYVVAMYDGAAVSIYVDGKLDATVAKTGTITYTASVAPAIGSTNGGTNYYFNGVIDTTRFYSRALSPAEIMSNYQAANVEFETRVGSTTTPDDGTWEAWKPTTNETSIDTMDTSSDKWQVDTDQSSSSTISKVSGTNIGNGNDGDCIVNNGTKTLDTTAGSSVCNGSGRSTAYAVNFSVNTLAKSGDTSVTVTSTPTGLTTGDEFLIINLQGTSTNYENVGKYETHIVSSVSSNTLNFTDSPLLNTYDGTTQKIMVQRIPNFGNVTVCGGNTGSGCTAAATVTGSAWDGTKNGVLFFRATGTVTVNSGGNINANTMGYRGGVTTTSNSETIYGNITGGTNGGDGAVGGGGGGGNGLGSNASGDTGGNEGGGTGKNSNCTAGNNGNPGTGGGGGGGVCSWSGGGGGAKPAAPPPSISTTGRMIMGAGAAQGGGGGGGVSMIGANGAKALGNGGGSGAGVGANGVSGQAGGGILTISANSISVSGSVTSSGGSGGAGGNGGTVATCVGRSGGGGGGNGGNGGTGGSIYLNGNSLTLGSSLVTATGGSGGGAGSGGAGVFCGDTNQTSGTGGTGYAGSTGNSGVVHLKYSSSISGTTSPTAYSNQSQSVLTQDGTGSMRVTTGRPEVDSATVGLWHLDETGGSGAYIKDSTANANNGTPGGTPGTTPVNGISGKARNFNGSSDYIGLGTNASLAATTALTAEAWVKINDLSANRDIVSRNGASGNRGWVLFTSTTASPANAIRFIVSSDGTTQAYRDSAIALTTGQWYHVVGTYSSAGLHVYINGALSDGTLTGSVPTSIYASTAPANIGWSNCNGTCTDYMNGTIDEVRVSNVVRTAEEVSEAYRMGRDHYLNRTIASTDLSGKTTLPFYIAADRPGNYLTATVGESAFANYQPDGNTVGLWHLDEQAGSGSYFKDSSGNTNNGSIGGTPVFVQGKIGKARNFNGAGAATQTDSISTGMNNTGSAKFSTGFTAEGWVYPTAWDASHNTLVGEENGFLLAINASGVSNDYIYAGGSFSSGVGTCPISLNSWTYKAVTYDGATIKSYVNGILCGTLAKTGSMASTSTIYIGMRDAAGTKQPIHGIVDEVRLSNTARSDTDIRQAYEVGLRTHPITINFNSAISHTDLLSGASDLTFTLMATPSGTTNPGDNIYPGDKIIVKENVNGTDYIAQGTVASVNISTGATTVTSWDAASTFPTGGFTPNATVFKWQREYWDIDGEVPDDQLNAITNLTLRVTNGNEGRTIWLDDLRSNTNYLTTPGGSTVTSSTGKRYLQYRAILSSMDESVSATLSAVTVDYVINTAPAIPSFGAPADTATNQSLTPALSTTSTDADSDYIRYKIQLCTDLAMTLNCQTFDQTSSQTGWSGQNAQTSTAYTSGTQGTYTVQTPLVAATTYYWQTYAIDPAGTNTWSATQATPRSFTTTTAPTAPTTPWTQGATNPTGLATTTPTFSAVYSDPNGDAANKYEINVNTNNTFTGTVMWATGATSMSNLASGVRSTNVTYAGTAIPLDGAGTTYYWQIRFTDVNGAVGAWSTTQSFTMNLKPNTPTLDSPLDTTTKGSLTPALKTTATDPDSDYLRYKIQICTDLAMTLNCQTFDQTSSQTNWSGQDAQTSTAYSSGTQATYTIPVASSLIPNTMYYWRSYAIDPAGSNTFSTTQTPFSFTTRILNESFNCVIHETSDDSSLTVVWVDRETSEDSYKLEKSTDGAAFAAYQTLAANTTSYQDTSIAENHTYQYRIAPFFNNGSVYGDWCTTPKLSLGLGKFSFQKFSFQGINFR